MQTAGAWCETSFAGPHKALPFSFTYDGQPSSSVLGNWKLTTADEVLSDKRQQRTLIYTDPKTGLELKCVAVRFGDFPAVEWTLFLRNTGTADTPVLSDIRAIDLPLRRQSATEFTLNHSNGDVNENGFNYRPLQTILEPGKAFQLTAAAGLPTQNSMPYFNIQYDTGGLIVALGWPGHWAASFERDDNDGLCIVGGQQHTHFLLHPGEEVRSPRVVLLWWEGDIVRSQNLWRRWMFAHNMLRPGGRPLEPILAGSNSDLFGFTGMTEQNQIQFIDRYVEEKIPIDYWWVDAGWYPVPAGAPWWTYGTWEPDKTRFPNGLKPVMDHARSKGLKTVLWFCVDSVKPGTFLYENHRDWLLGDCLFNYGNPEAWRWWLELVDRYITDWGIDIYRTDNDINPLPHWLAADTEDRKGITEIRHVTGFLAFYDELLRRHPNLLIDNCCAGGRRNDIEILRRAVPLWRSDVWSMPEPMQCQTYGLAQWIPFFGHLAGPIDPYVFRSNMYPSGVMNVDMRNTNQDFELLRRLVAQYRQIAPNLLGDYYPLTPYSQANDAWIAWQFDRPEQGEGIVQAFRRTGCQQESMRVKLRGLEPDAVYSLINLDVPGTIELRGQELLEQGLPIAISAKPGAVVITYKR